MSYYRDYQKTNKEYINLNEAIVYTTDNGFNTEHGLNKFRLFDYKKNLNFSRNDISLLYDTITAPNFNEPNKFIPNGVLSNHGGNEFFILMTHDPIRNFKATTFSFIHVFSKDFLANHSFSKIEKIYNGDLLLYKIKFNSKETVGYGVATAYGEIFIQPEDYSIHKIDYTCVDKKNNKHIFNTKLEYGYSESTNSLMHLKYISFNNLFNLIDETDTDYFRIIDDKISDSYLELKMSNLVDEKSVSNKEAYNLFYSNHKVMIKNIDVKDSTITIHFKNKIYDRQFNYQIASNQLKDINGNFLNHKDKLEFYQYRELFVQEQNAKIKFDDDCYLQHFPLLNNCITKLNGDHKYWMNTPKGIKNETK